MIIRGLFLVLLISHSIQAIQAQSQQNVSSASFSSTTTSFNATTSSSSSSSTRSHSTTPLSFPPNSTRVPTTTTAEPGGCSVNRSAGNCLYSIKGVPRNLHVYIGWTIIAAFIVGQTIHYFYLEAQQAKIHAEKYPPRPPGPAASQEEAEKDKEMQQMQAFGIATKSYHVSTVRTPHGPVTTVLEKRPLRPVFPTHPLTPAPIYQSHVKTVQKDEAIALQAKVSVDKWGRGPELLSLINETAVPYGQTEERARFVMELVQRHVEKMRELKVFVQGLVEEKLRIWCGSDNIEAENFTDVSLDLKLEVSAPVQLLVSVFTVKLDGQPPQQQKSAAPIPLPPARVSELTSIPNKETPKQPDAESMAVKKASNRDELAPPLLLQTAQNSLGREKPNEKNVTPKVSPIPSTPAPPEKPSSEQMALQKRKKTKESTSGHSTHPSSK
ncbi:unnamed protein product [Caenorhabditis sp. 36 PRJEB53466]|nr:unnamed protein product [Caenorhabditis sp. 36 PRJEB53466]